MVGEDEKLREAVTLPLTKLPFWLATIQTGRIPDLGVRNRVVEFQQRVCDVLEAAFFGEPARPAVEEVIVERPWRQRPLEERNTELRTVASIGRFGNHALAWWYLEKVAQVADFPRRLLPAWRQADFDMHARPALTITATLNGEAH